MKGDFLTVILSFSFSLSFSISSILLLGVEESLSARSKSKLDYFEFYRTELDKNIEKMGGEGTQKIDQIKNVKLKLKNKSSEAGFEPTPRFQDVISSHTS